MNFRVNLAKITNLMKYPCWRVYEVLYKNAIMVFSQVLPDSVYSGGGAFTERIKSQYDTNLSCFINGGHNI